MHENKWRVLFRRIGVSALVFIAPETILTWAYLQRAAARSIVSGKHDLLHLNLPISTDFNTEDAERKDEKAQTKPLSIIHAYFIAMGGFVIKVTDSSDPDYRHVIIMNDLDEKLHAVKPDEHSVTSVDTVTIRDLIREIDVADLEEKSKGDGLSKAIAMLQAAWFITSTISRGVSDLALTELEISTLAFASVSFALYMLWWDKPQGVMNQMLLHPELKLNEFVQNGQDGNLFERLLNMSFVAIDERSEWRSAARVPSLWWGATDRVDSDVIQAFAPIIIGAIFGGVHCIAWKFFFPTAMEQLLWRISAVAVGAGPFLILFTVFIRVLTEDSESLGFVSTGSVFAIMLLTMSYLVARLALFTLSLTALREIPYSAYRTVPWLSYIPHL
jgi:hypothetical protein